MKMEPSFCSKCGGMMLEHRDYIYDIDYWMCFNCGRVVFNVDDGLGLKRLKLPVKRSKKRERYSNKNTN